jgi:pyruvate ferredoxin oxidoreductase gamma subunit
MFEIRWHGRAGQGVMTVSRLLAYAALLEGKHVQAFPHFGPERIGAPMSGYTRISDTPIQVHDQIYYPDMVVVLDDTVPKIVNVTVGLKESGKLLINSKDDPSAFREKLNLSVKCFTIDAEKISFDVLGNARAFNTAMLGGLLKVEPVVSFETVSRVLVDRFGKDVGEKNVQVLQQGGKEVKEA